MGSMNIAVSFVLGMHLYTCGECVWNKSKMAMASNGILGTGKGKIGIGHKIIEIF